MKEWFIWNWGNPEGDQIYAIVLLVLLWFSVLVVTSLRDWRYIDDEGRAKAGARFRCLGTGVWFSFLVCICLILVWEIW